MGRRVVERDALDWLNNDLSLHRGTRSHYARILCVHFRLRGALFLSHSADRSVCLGFSYPGFFDPTEMRLYFFLMQLLLSINVGSSTHRSNNRDPERSTLRAALL